MDTKIIEHYPIADNFPIWIQRNLHQMNDVPTLHKHAFVELIYVMNGSATHHFENITDTIQAGDIFIVNPGEVHGYTVKQEQTLDIINCLFAPNFLHDQLLNELKISHSIDFYYVQPFLQPKARFHNRLNLHGTVREQAYDILKMMHEELTSKQAGYEAFVTMQLIQLLILLSRCYNNSEQYTIIQTNPNERLMQRICGYIERNYAQKISLSIISDLFHMSARQLNRYFNQYIGCSVIEYVQRIRIQKARQLLEDSDQIIAAIANAVGYEDAAFFTTLFTRTVGCSPGEYRKRSKQTHT